MILERPLGMRPADPEVVLGELFVVPGRAVREGHQVVGDRLAAGVLASRDSTRIIVNSLGSQSTPPSMPPLNGSFDVLGAQAGGVLDVPHQHRRVLLAVDQVDVDPPVGAVHVGL